ncbi:hypothetical protein ACLKA7_005396 [Drosophila subpalustris]
MDSADTPTVAPSGFCLFCTAKTSLVCHRCGDFYCSKECQLKDWQRHRYICFAIPSLVHPMACSVFQVAQLASGSAQKLQADEATDTLLPELSVGANKQQISTNSSPTLSTASISTNECDKKSNTNVKVKNITSTKQANSNNNNNNKINVNSNGTQKKDDLTKIRSPSSSSVYITDMISANRCFIRDASEAAEKAYFEICEKVDSMGKTLPKKTNIKPFEYALLHFNGRFHRVKSIGKQMSAPRLLLLDEGYVRVDKKIEMREICEELLELPFCSTQVQLKDVPNYFLNNQAQGFLKQFVGEQQKTNSQILGPVLNPPFEMRRLRTNNKEGFDVIVVDNANASKGILGAFDSVNANDLSHLYFQLSEFRDSEPYKPILKEYVIAKYENSWYRARVIEIKQNLYTVKYLEFTNEATVTQQDIRRYPADLTVPCHTNTCLIEGFPHRLTKRQIDFLTEKLHINSRLHIDSVSYYQDMALIKSKNLIDELNKML